MASFIVRPYREPDAAAAAQLYYDTIHAGTGAFYDAAQRRAWAPEVPDEADWGQWLSREHTLVAEDGHGLAGYMTITRAGHIDLAYVRADRMGQGVAAALYDEIESWARLQGFTTLTVHASALARRFFARRDWRVTEEQRPLRNGVELYRYRMCKALR